MTAPDPIWPVGGYAPGHYQCRCEKCGQLFVGEKRAYQCADCVIQDLKVLTRSPLAEALAVPEVAVLVEAAEGLSAIIDKHETKGPLPDIAMMLCWLAAQNVRAALRAIGERAE